MIRDASLQRVFVLHQMATLDERPPVGCGVSRPTRSYHRNVSSRETRRNLEPALLIWRLDERALERISSHPDTPIDVLEQLSCYPHPDVRALVAENEKTPDHVRMALTKDENPNVRYQLAE